MDPLSALRALGPTGLNPAAMPNLAAGGAPIPLQDLAKLSQASSAHALNLAGTPNIGADQSPAVSLRSAAAGPASVSGTSFDNLLTSLVKEVGAKQDAAGQTLTGLLSGQDVSLHQAMIAMEEASVSFQLMVEVRNKLLESYQELMRMQI